MLAIVLVIAGMVAASYTLQRHHQLNLLPAIEMQR